MCWMVECEFFSVWTGRREEAQKPSGVPLNDLRVLLRLAKEQYLKMQTAMQPRVSCVPVEKENHTSVTAGNHQRTGANPTRSAHMFVCSVVLRLSGFDIYCVVL